MNDLEDVDLGMLVSNQMEVESLQKAVKDAPNDIAQLKDQMRRVLSRNAWQDRLDPNRGRRWQYQEFAKFITDPLPDGLGTDLETMRQLLGDTPERAKFEEAVNPPLAASVGNPTGTTKPLEREQEFFCPKNSCKVAKGGNVGGENISYLVRRLRRDAPEIADALERGEYPSARQAAIAAGILKVPTPLDILRAAWRKASKEERDQFIEEIGKDGW